MVANVADVRAMGGWPLALLDMRVSPDPRGVAGSLLQLLELAGCGATLDLDRLPRPEGVPLERWLVTFPSFGFQLTGPPEGAREACAVFHGHELACAVCGSVDDSRTLHVAAGGATAPVWDVAAEPLTTLGG